MMLDCFPVCRNVFKLFAFLDTEFSSQFTAAGALAFFFAQFMTNDFSNDVGWQAATTFVIALRLGFAFGAFPACASIWMFVVAPKDVERGMPLFVAMFQVIIALGSFFGGRIVDQLGSSVLLSLATALVGCGFVTVLVLGRNVSNRLAAQPG